MKQFRTWFAGSFAVRIAATASGGSSCGMPNSVRMTLAVAVPDGNRSFSLRCSHSMLQQL
jgi:hypothetical protein